jgi:hypothetical protein
MRKPFVAMAAIVVLAAPVAASAKSDPLTFSIQNNSRATIDSIVYGQSSDDDWSDNILQEYIEPGDTVEVTVDDALDGCMYDFFYTFDDGSDFVERVNMCEINGETYEFTNGE